MKIENQRLKVAIQSIACGNCFTCPRTDNKGEGLYMRVDGNSGLIKMQNLTSCYAVNLETAQLRSFDRAFMVMPVNCVVTMK